MKALSKYITYLDLFSGTGGFALGLKQAGFVFKKHYFSEIDVHASSNYLKNFKNAVQLGDIKTVGRKKIEKPDIITFGSPCQDLSLAGKREGLKGKRSGLFFEALRLIRLYSPRIFIFENVKGIFSSNSGKDFEAVLRAFADIGLYDLQWQLLNTAWFLPQNRERLYLVGHLRGEARPKVFPIGESNKRDSKNDKKKNVGSELSPTLDTKSGENTHRSPFVWQQKKPRLFSLRNIEDSSSIFQVSEATKKGYSIAEHGDSIDLSFLESNKRRGRVGKGKAHTLDTASRQYTLHKNGIRRLTPIECERLQGFPDNWTQYGSYNETEKEISDTQRYKMLGNAVSVVTVKAVATKLLKNNSELGGCSYMKYEEEPEIVLSGTVSDIVVPELNVSYSRNGLPFLGKITNSNDTADFIRTTFKGEIEMQEIFIILYLNNSLNIIGYYRHTKGSINAVLLDTRIVLSTALKCLATSIVIAHNHPSQNLNASTADIELTTNLKNACNQLNIKLLDSIIVTNDNYFSFADNAMAGLEPIRMPNEPFHEVIKKELEQKIKHNKLSLEKLALSYGIKDKTEVKELTELAIVETARSIGQQLGLSTGEKFRQIVELYNNQVNLSHRTSQSILLQQYSTPAPIAYLMGVFCGVDQPGMYLEPSAGNGMLTVAGKPEYFCVNEIDKLRNNNLRKQGFCDVTATDASAGSICSQFNKSQFDAVLTNPPFGKLDTKKVFDGYPIQSLEHVMALYALQCMKDEGRAAIIIGGHTGWDAKGRMQAGKNRLFFNYLYSHYKVVDVIPINGKKLYSRQGTGFNTRLILIEGRKEKPTGNAPVFDVSKDTMINTFEDLYARLMEVSDWKTMSLEDLESEANLLKQKLVSNNLGLKTIYMLGRTLDTGNADSYIPNYENLYGKFEALKNKDSKNTYLFEVSDKLLAFDEDAELIAKTLHIHYFKVVSNNAFRFIFTAIEKENTAASLRKIGQSSIKHILVSYPFRTSDNKEDKYLHNQITRAQNQENLGAPYMPSSNACIVLDTQVPDSMAYETQEALAQIKEAVGGDVDNFVRDRLGYPSKTALCKALSAEQTDAVMMGIYNIEARKQGMIIGDQTGIGKGRVAAAMIRYACHQGLKPVFLTEKANLFSDIYRDLYAIGSGRLKPFIVNGRESKTDIKDEDGNVVYQALPVNEQQAIFISKQIPAAFDFVVATYTQFNSPERKPEKPAFLNAIAAGNIFIMDEAHNSSGASNTGNFLQGVIAQTQGVVFLSATFAKRPDNMPIYAMKTAIADCNMSKDELVESIQRGGVALQEVLSSQLVAEGQMLRRERSFEGVEVNYITLTEKAPEHRAIADNITGIVRDIIAFQKNYIDTIVEELDDIAVAEGKQVDIREGTSQAGVDNTPYFSKVFNIINQMLFSLKASSVADRAIERLKEGKKPVIAFSSTMGSFLEDMEDERGLPVSDGSVINPDFSEVLRRGLEGVMRYTEKGQDGTPEYKKFEVSELPADGQTVYFDISRRIEEVSTGITLSPIDVVIKKIRDAGYSVAEVTGRKYELQFADENEQTQQGEPKFIKGDRVKVITSGKTGIVTYSITTGNIVPGASVFDNVAYEYAIKLDSGNQWTFKESELAPESYRVPMAMVMSRRKINTNDAFRKFNNNEVDVLMINQSGSTGASAHAIPTMKVPKSEVRQRVMIVLQAELDINTEVQKRGRINRTGQIIKPIYDYVSSAIPAESRLMMMLQKKLKSLDANTASNQKQSSKILDVPDFLNKYGDKVVKEYLLENPEVNRLLDDPLRLKNKTDSDGGEAENTENAAHKVSGRVAVLSAKMQLDFYTEITERYNDYIGYLQQIGEYDLELEAMNLEAETLNSKVVKMGKGSGSLFSEDSILETIEANVLKKPFTVAELDNLLIEALQGRDADLLQLELRQDYDSTIESALKTEELSIIAHYEEVEKGVTQEKKFQKLKTEEERKDYIDKRKEQIAAARIKAIEQSKNKAAARKHYLTKLFSFFYVGRNLRYPVDNFGGYKELVPSVFLGFAVDYKQKNPFLPSKIKLRFAIANSNKYLAIPASYDSADTIIGASIDTPQLSKEQLLSEWETYTKENNRDRRTRHVITGNLLQAFSDYRGKLVNYTTIDGKITKGILMPENWAADEQVQDKVSVPVLQALPVIKSLVTGKHITTSTGIGFLRQQNLFKIIVPASRKAAGDIFLDKQLLELVDGNNFQRSGDKMVATLSLNLIDDFVEIIQNNHSCAVTITRYQFTSLERQNGKLLNRMPIRLPEPEREEKEINKIRLLELEAKALILKLRLLAA